LRKTIADQVSDLFINSLNPINSMLAFAERGKKQETHGSCRSFESQVSRFSKLAELLCGMTDDQEGRRMVQISFHQLDDLKTKLINAIEVLAEIPESKAALENVNVFKKAWVDQVKTFMDAVDDIISVQDFLSVVENHILEDVKTCCKAMQAKDSRTVGDNSRAIYQRSGRLCDVVAADMDRYEPGLYTEKVMEAVRVLRLEVMPVFTKAVCQTIKALRAGAEMDENEFIDACRLVYDGVRDVRHAFLLRGDLEEEEEEEEEVEKGEKKEEKVEKKEVTTIKEAVSKLNNEEIKKQLDPNNPVYWTAIWSDPRVRTLLNSSSLGGSTVEGFTEEKDKLVKEVAKWEDSNNDIIVLAKHMCSIMTDMTDFIKGRGRIKTTDDVINSAQEISKAGTKLDQLARRIAERCPESSAKSDLLAYLQRIILYCHQLSITSKVKADVHSVSGELIVSGLDSATSLIQAARNLMEAVVLTVKASYVASRMFNNHKQAKSPDPTCPPSPVVVWKMRTPEKQPLVRREPPEEVRARVRRGADPHQSSPMKALNLFQERRLSFSSCSSVSSVDTIGQS